MLNLQQVRRAVVCAALVALGVVFNAGSGKAITTGGCLNASVEPARFRPGVRNAPGKRQLNAGHLKQVLQSLREKTGWQSLDFDEAGFLVCPEPGVFSGGSAAARRLLGAALFGGAAYDLEAHNHSQAVAFARQAVGTTHLHPRTGAGFSSYPVQIDFADFHQLRGEGPALRAFDTGIAILHELAHGVWQLRDAASDEEEPGECESFINQIRRELQLPERRRYEARARLSRPNTIHPTRLLAELHFVRVVETQGRPRPKRYRLQWEAEAVGPVHFNQDAKAGLTAFR